MLIKLTLDDGKAEKEGGGGGEGEGVVPDFSQFIFSPESFSPMNMK